MQVNCKKIQVNNLLKYMISVILFLFMFSVRLYGEESTENLQAKIVLKADNRDENKLAEAVDSAVAGARASEASGAGVAGAVEAVGDDIEGAGATEVVDVELEEKPKTQREKYIEVAKNYLGLPYRFGAVGPDKFDCSGFVDFVTKEALGIELPRNSKDIYKACEIIPDSDREAGDLVFFSTGGSASIFHLGIYIGDDKFISALSEGKHRGISISWLNRSYWGPKYFATGRIIPSDKEENETAETMEEIEENINEIQNKIDEIGNKIKADSEKKTDGETENGTGTGIETGAGAETGTVKEALETGNEKLPVDGAELSETENGEEVSNEVLEEEIPLDEAVIIMDMEEYEKYLEELNKDN